MENTYVTKRISELKSSGNEHFERLDINEQVNLACLLLEENPNLQKTFRPQSKTLFLLRHRDITKEIEAFLSLTKEALAPFLDYLISTFERVA